MKQRRFGGLMLLFMCGAIIFTFRGCKKEGSLVSEPLPEMIYKEYNLHIRDMNLSSIDLDGDGVRDLNFQVLPVGDAVLKRDKKQFYVYSRIHSALLNDANDQSPALRMEERIQPNHPGFDWWEISAVVLAEKISLEDGSYTWEGAFKEGDKFFLPVRVAQNTSFHYGWLELSIDQESETMVVYRSGIAKEPGKVVKAGR